MQSKLKISAVLISMCMMSLTGCASNSDKSNDISKEINFITPDENTVKHGEENKAYNNVDDSQDGTDNEYTVNEVDIGGNVSVDWQTTEDGSIVYNGITFHDLSNQISTLEMPCDRNAFTKFLITTFKAETTDVYVTVDLVNSVDSFDENSTESVEYEDTSIFEDTMEQKINYKAICNKYNDKVSWQLTLYENQFKHFGNVYGCKSFIILDNIGENKTVEFNSSDLDENTDVEGIESTETVDDASLVDENDSIIDESNNNISNEVESSYEETENEAE